MYTHPYPKLSRQSVARNVAPGNANDTEYQNADSPSTSIYSSPQNVGASVENEREACNVVNYLSTSLEIYPPLLPLMCL